jgi:hypothetical protein
VSGIALTVDAQVHMTTRDGMELVGRVAGSTVTGWLLLLAVRVPADCCCGVAIAPDMLDSDDFRQ